MTTTAEHPETPTWPTRPCVFAAPAYANSVPLAHCIPAVWPGARVVLDYPANIVPPLLNGEVDAALVPVAALFAMPDFVPIAGIGICAEKRVRSVLLRCRKPLAEVCTVELDPASRTSNALAQILLRKHWRRNVRIVTADAATPADAAVVIGDRALCEPPGTGGDLDLAAHWNQMTGLPFVFAVWARRRGHPHAAALARCVHAAKVAGVAMLPELARDQAAKLGLSEAVCQDYFATCIYYDAGQRETLAMERFRQEMLGMDSTAQSR